MEGESRYPKERPEWWPTNFGWPPKPPRVIDMVSSNGDIPLSFVDDLGRIARAFERIAAAQESMATSLAEGKQLADSFYQIYMGQAEWQRSGPGR